MSHEKEAYKRYVERFRDMHPGAEPLSFEQYLAHEDPDVLINQAMELEKEILQRLEKLLAMVGRHHRRSNP